MKLCLDLFCGLGGFSQAFAAADDWAVFTVDIAERFEPDLRADVLDLRPADILAAAPVDGWGDLETFVVLASPPCTEFSPVQNLNGEFDPDPKHVLLAFHALGLCHALPADYWMLENPRGRLRSYIGPPDTVVTYCQYGEDRMKPTDLWGEFPPPFSGRRCAYGDSCHINTRAGSNAARSELGKETAAERAKVPAKLSAAILDAVEQPDQTTQRTVADYGLL